MTFENFFFLAVIYAFPLFIGCDNNFCIFLISYQLASFSVILYIRLLVRKNY
jgi:hypothetical protein